LKSEARSTILKRAWKGAKSKMKDMFKDRLQEAALQTMCNTIWNNAIDKTINVYEVTESNVLSAVDVFNVSGITKECKDTSSESGAVNCAKNVVSAFSNFDPSGLLTVAG